MLDSRLEKLNYAIKLMLEGKYRDALETITSLEKKGTLKPEDQLSSLILKGYIYSLRGQYEDIVKVGELAYQMSQKLGKVSESISALIFKSFVIFLGKIEEGLDFVLEAEKLLNSLTDKSSILISMQKGQLLHNKSWSYFYNGDLNKALEIALQALLLSEKFGNKISIAYNLMLIGYIYLSSGEPNEALDYAMKSLTLQRELNNEAGVANCLSLVGDIYYNKGDFNKALKFCERGLSVKEINNPTKTGTYRILGTIYQEKGELDRALKFFKRAVKLAEELNLGLELEFNLMYIGGLYRRMGDYDQAIEYLERSLVLSENGFTLVMILSLLRLIYIHLDKGSREQVQLYIVRLKELADQKESRIFTQAYLMAKALLLKTSGRIRNHAEAEMLLKQIVEDEIIVPQIHILSLISLCDLFLEELSMSNNPEVLEEINPLIMRLVNVAENQTSFSWLAEAKVLQAKMALIQMNVEEAKQLLTEAQRIADLNGLNLLAAKISDEHDKLLDHLNIWNTIKKDDLTIAERIKLASFDGVIDRLQEKRVVEPTELTPEVPVLLLIITEGGSLLFSNTFSEELKFEEDIISGFLTAFNTFSSEIFSKGLDRAKFGENTIILQSTNSFLFCYLFKGQTYLAKQKLTKFTERIQKKSSIWETLEKCYKRNQLLEIKDSPYLENIITDIFIG